MSFFRKLLVFIALLLMFLMGAAGILTLLAFGPVAQPVHEGIRYMPLTSRIFVFVLFVVLPLAVLIMALRDASGKKGVLVTQTENGVIYITDFAVVKCIRSALRQIPEVINVHSTVKDTARGIAAKVRVQLRMANRPVPQLDQHMRAVVQDTLSTMLGIKNLAEPQIIIEDIKVGGEPVPPTGTVPPEITFESQV